MKNLTELEYRAVNVSLNNFDVVGSDNLWQIGCMHCIMNETTDSSGSYVNRSSFFLYEYPLKLNNWQKDAIAQYLHKLWRIKRKEEEDRIAMEKERNKHADLTLFINRGV